MLVIGIAAPSKRGTTHRFAPASARTRSALVNARVLSPFVTSVAGPTSRGCASSATIAATARSSGDSGLWLTLKDWHVPARLLQPTCGPPAAFRDDIGVMLIADEAH